ncbi:hypothetical protein BDP27DRAFT_1412562 [Rhodocollybia butyracea]|uniref:Uncharacterized protein n=1 Tax=Rhodocollybia butyracea TaxID=206335 RepID=A0A9P5UGN8_9AGAR|nr:hypothetical protein BDP27DRAFT_1412562 [Rhodocollybia butyracea]
MSTSTPPTKIRSRLGAAVRRTSSVLSLTRPTTPGVSSSPKPTGRDRSASVASDSSSISRPSLDTSAQPSQPASTPSVIPSPIPESPAREDAANAEEVHDGLRGSKTGPTPLAQVIAAPTEPETAEAPTEPETAEASTEPETAEASTEPETAETVESDTSAPAIIGSANGPDTFTEEPDEIPLGSSKPTESAGDFPRDIPDAPTKGIEAVTQQTTASPNLEAAPSYFEIPVQPPAKPLTDSALQNEIVENTIGTIEDGEAGVSLDQTTPRPHGPADTENANVFYAFSEVLEVAPTPAQAGPTMV